MTFFTVIKCTFCFRWSCSKRYQIVNQTHYSHFGFVKTECLKKLGKYSYLTMDEIKEKAKKEKRMKRRQEYNDDKNEE